MFNRTIVASILLAVILSLAIPFAIPAVARAQTCRDASGNPIECPPNPDEGKKKKPTPTRPRSFPSATPTSPSTLTPSVTPVVSPTPTKVPVVPMMPGGDGPGQPAPDPGGGWPTYFGSDTIQMLFDGDSLHSFPGRMAGLLGLLALVGLGVGGITFIRIRAARINYEKYDEDTGLIFDKQKAEGGSMPLLTEIGFPDGDAHGKNASYLEEPPAPGAEITAADALSEPITGGDEPAKPHVVPDDSEPARYAASAVGPKSLWEEESAGRGPGLPAPKKFPDMGDGRAKAHEPGNFESLLQTPDLDVPTPVGEGSEDVKPTRGEDISVRDISLTQTDLLQDNAQSHGGNSGRLFAEHGEIADRGPTKTDGSASIFDPDNNAWENSNTKKPELAGEDQPSEQTTIKHGDKSTRVDSPHKSTRRSEVDDDDD